MTGGDAPSRPATPLVAFADPATSGSGGGVAVVERLRQAGCVAAEEEAAELRATAAGDGDLLDALVDRRCTGEPLAWIVGTIRFCGVPVLVHPGVYVPRGQSEPLVWEAVRRLPHDGVAVDLCTGSGAVAVVLARCRPAATVVAGDIDPLAVACARANGVAASASDLASGLPPSSVGRADVVTAVVPYVPSDALPFLPRDVLAHEPRHALDGGPDGTRLLLRAAEAAARLLRPGGSLLLELGGDQAERMGPALSSLGFEDTTVLADEDGDTRAVVARLR